MIRMKQLRTVSKKEKIVFPIVVAIVVSLILPSAASLIGCLMLGNLMKESGVVERLSKAVQNELNNIVVIFLGVTVGATATAQSFLNFQTLSILCVGIVAFGVGSAGGVLLNGTPAGFENICEDDMGKTKPYVLHAEANAITKVAKSANNCDGSTLYVTASPCIECAKLIIQAGIKRVVYADPYRSDDGIQLLKKVGIECVQLDVKCPECVEFEMK